MTENTEARAILAHLESVQAQREARAVDPWLGDRVLAVKEFQQRRFAHTYADLLDSYREQAAARFFLDELYGPGDFTARDAQFARIVPALVRLLPKEVVDTVSTLAELHALSEQLDSRLARHVHSVPIVAEAYAEAWRACGMPAERQRQIDLMLDIGRALDRHTGSRFLGHSLRLMRRPAQGAGLGELQALLERGFTAFQAIGGADEFLQTVASREARIGSWLFEGSLPDRAPPQWPWQPEKV